ncbi:MAG: GNAT family N-acetyltransferase [Lachnospiraceae bacterium]|nr:GNAT family N-acetyltransferase [Lachnospiraceae bacterium]
MLREVVFLLSENAYVKERLACGEACRMLRAVEIAAEVHKASEVADVLLEGRDGLLVLTDDPERMRSLLEKQIPVIAYRHEGCADASFSGAPYVFEEPQEIDADSYIKAYQRAAGEPWEILRTDRLLLRETTVEDIDRLYEIYADPEMTLYMEGLFENPADEKRYMEDYIRNVYQLLGFGVWTVIESGTGDIIGRAGFSVRTGFDRPEIGFLIGKKWQGKGYAREAVEGCLVYGRDILGFAEVQALVKEGNAVSVHLLESLGFQIRETVEVDEDIYGGVYPGEGNARTAIGSARRGRYLEMNWR